MLLALYMWYEGVNMMERFGMRKVTIKTDENIDEAIDYYNDDTVEIVGHFNTEDDLTQEIEQDLAAAVKAGGTLMEDFIKNRREEEKAKFEALVATPLGERAYRQTYNIPDDAPISNFVNVASNFNVPDAVFTGFYSDTANSNYYYSDAASNLQAVPENQAFSLEDEEYRYLDHFNF